MTKKQWLALLALYVTYLFLGACVFFFLEKDHESVQRENDYKLYEKLLVAIQESGLNRSAVLDLESYCGRPLTENADLDAITPRLWDFYNSVFFVLTVVSTLGYGNIHPTMPVTRWIMMFYAIIGIPMNGILLTSLAQFFSTVFLRAHRKYKRYESRCGLATDVLKYLVPGILFFIFVPAIAFSYFENWTYDESVYYAFVTLTTIGFGDIVAGQKQFKEFNADWILVYKSLLLCWIIFGLGYLIMILGFITRAMRSKKMAQFEQKVVETLTHFKFWHGFSKDIGYLRRIMNELYLDKFKPVFIDEQRQKENLILHRSKSLPNFAFGVEEEDFFDPVGVCRRKRANSDFFSWKKLPRVRSETDLRRIDRRATFASTTQIPPDELIRHVVGVMGGSLRRRCCENEAKGVDVFSDDEILRSEAWKEASVASINYPPTYEEAISTRRKRMRALSECPPSSDGQVVESTDNLEWTWSGARATNIFDIVNERHKRSLMERSGGRRLSSSIASGMKWLAPRRKRVRTRDSENVTGSKKSVCSSGEVLPAETGTREGHYMTYTPGSGLGLLHGRQGLSKPEKSLLQLYMSGDHLFSDENRREMLGESSLTEFLRILSSLHSRIGNQREELQADPPGEKPESLAELFSEPPGAKSSEKLPEASNLKRLGRFLLKSYSKADSNAECGSSTPRRAIRLVDNYHTVTGNPSIRIDMDDFPQSVEEETSRANGFLSSAISLHTRRGSTPAIASLGDRTRIGLSSESVFTDPRRVSRHLSCSAKPSLSDVKEIIK